MPYQLVQVAWTNLKHDAISLFPYPSRSSPSIQASLTSTSLLSSRCPRQSEHSMHRILSPPINRVYFCWNNYYDAVTPEKQFSSPDVVVVMPCVVQYSRGSEAVVSVWIYHRLLLRCSLSALRNVAVEMVFCIFPSFAVSETAFCFPQMQLMQFLKLHLNCFGSQYCVLDIDNVLLSLPIHTHLFFYFFSSFSNKQTK